MFRSLSQSDSEDQKKSIAPLLEEFQEKKMEKLVEEFF